MAASAKPSESLNMPSAPASFARFFDDTRTPCLATKRLIIRPARNDDFHGWSQLRQTSRAFLTQWEGAWNDDIYKRASFRDKLRHERLAINRGEGFPFLLVRREDRQILGGVILSHIRRGEEMACTAGAWMGQPYAQKGYMAEAMRAILPFAFQKLGLTRMEACCLPHNVPSIRILEGVGFRQEGLARRYRHINGAWRDHLLLAAISDERESDAGTASGLPIGEVSRQKAAGKNQTERP